MRLGFAVAIHVDPDVLLVDEVLAVGDEAFTHKCLDKFAEFRRRGRTVLLVTHSLDLVTRFCDEALWLDGGRRRGAGRSEARHRRVSAGRGRRREPATADGAGLESTRRSPTATRPMAPGHVQGGRRALGVARGGDRARRARRRRRAAGARVSVRRADGDSAAGPRAPAGARTSSFGVGIFNADGVCCYGTNTQIEGARAERAERRRRGRASPSTVSISWTAPTSSTSRCIAQNGAPYDYHRLLHTFR